MSRLSRSLLAKSLPNNPRLRAEFEQLAQLMDDTTGGLSEAKEQLDALAADLAEGGKYQRAADILEAISNLPDRVGAVEILADGEAAIRPVDSEDPASLLSRGAAYTVLVGIGGKGTTAQRPALPATAVGLYFDTTLAANGKPIFWTGALWVDSAGAAV